MRSSLVISGILASFGTFAACVGGDDNSIPDGGPDVTNDVVATDVTQNDGANESGTTGPINGVIQSVDGDPLPSKVDINGTVTQADVSGHFTVPDPGPTYTATFSFQQGTFASKTFVVYQGLTRRDPTLNMPVRFSASTSTVDVTVKNAAVASSFVSFAPKAVIGYNNVQPVVIPSDGGASPVVVTIPNTAQSGQLVFFQQTVNDGGGVTGYPTVAMASAALAANGTTSTTFTAAAPSGTGTLSGSVNAPSAGGWVVDQTQLLAIFNNTTPLTLESGTASVFSYLAPNINGVKLMVSASAEDTAGEASMAWKTGLSVNTSGIGLTLPAPPIVASPAQNANVPLSTGTFGYNNLSGVGFATFLCETPTAGPDGGAPGANYYVHIVTTASSVVAPTDAALALSLPPTTSPCAFTVSSMSIYKSVDDAAGPGGFANSLGPTFSVIDGSFSTSAPLHVTAQ